MADGRRAPVPYGCPNMKERSPPLPTRRIANRPTTTRSLHLLSMRSEAPPRPTLFKLIPLLSFRFQVVFPWHHSPALPKAWKSSGCHKGQQRIRGTHRTMVLRGFEIFHSIKTPWTRIWPRRHGGRPFLRCCLYFKRVSGQSFTEYALSDSRR